MKESESAASSTAKRKAARSHPWRDDEAWRDDDGCKGRRKEGKKRRRKQGKRSRKEGMKDGWIN